MSLIDEELLPGERDEEARKQLQCVLVTVSDKSSSKNSSTVLAAGLGNLSSKNRLRDRFSGQRFSETNFRQESRKGF